MTAVMILPAPRRGGAEVMERPVLISSGKNTLVGILNSPDGSRGRAEIGVIILHSGSRGRLGSTFNNVFFARQLAARGYPCLRFDPHGIGDSTGTIEDAKMDDYYKSIQLGRFVDDTHAAITEFRRIADFERLILFGICGGAITALLAGGQSPEVSGLVLISIPVLLDSADQDKMDRLPREYAWRTLVGLYASKVLSLKAWKRLLTLQSETGLIMQLVRATVKRPKRRRRTDSEALGKRKDIPVNELFINALDSVVGRGARVLFLFGDDDAYRWEFEREFYDVCWEENPRYQRCCDVHYVPRCNHLFTLVEWQRQALELTLSFIDGA
jgi:pimeloyl-ACP methyl ester carboxylesterase